MISFAVVLQALAANSVFVIPSIAPSIAADIDLPVALIGLQVGIVYLGSMLMSIVAGSLSESWGPIRCSQFSLLLCAVGLLLATSAWIPALGIASFILGLGYGLINPPSGDLLNRVVSSRRRSLVFSLKQTAVPFGGMLSGLIGPPLALSCGWRTALLVSAGACLAAIGLLNPFARRLGKGRGRVLVLIRDPFRDLSMVWTTSAALRLLTLSGFWFAAVQFTLTTFLVTLMVEDIRLDLVTAGVGFAVFQVSAVAGRIGWGFIAGFRYPGTSVLFAAYIMSLGALVSLLFMTLSWPVALIYICLAVLGVSAASWNGVFISEIVTASPPDASARAIGGSFAFTFCGALLGPLGFAAAYTWLESYIQAMGLVAIFAVLGCFCCWKAMILRP